MESSCFSPNYGRLEGCNYFCAGFGLQKSISSADSGVTPALQLDQGFPTVNDTLPNLDPSLENGGAYPHINVRSNKPATDNSWTLSIQRELPASILLDVAYVGSHNTGLPSGDLNLNQVDPKYLSLGNELTLPIACLGNGTCPNSIAAGVKSPYTGFTGSIGQALRPFPQFARIDNYFSPTGYNTYHSLQIRAQKRYSNGLSFLGSYTLSKNIGVTNGDSFGDIEGGAATFSLNTFNRGAERAILGFDQTHVISLSWSYDLPFGRGKRFLSHSNFVDNYLLGGWQINSIESYASGNPLSIGGGPYLPIFNFGGFGGNRPNWNPAAGSGRSSVSLSNFNPSTDRYLVTGPFSSPAPFTFGDAPPRQPNLRSPFHYNEDFSVFKRVPLGAESRFLEFRAEFFNIFNRVVIGGPNTNLNSANFGIISSQANTPRVIQFGLKVIF